MLHAFSFCFSVIRRYKSQFRYFSTDTKIKKKREGNAPSLTGDGKEGTSSKNRVRRRTKRTAKCLQRILPIKHTQASDAASQRLSKTNIESCKELPHTIYVDHAKRDERTMGSRVSGKKSTRGKCTNFTKMLHESKTTMKERSE